MANAALLERLKKASTVKMASVLGDSKVFGKKDLIPVPVPMMNVLFSGELDGGFSPGLTQFAGPSKHFKTSFVLLAAKAFLDKYEDGIIIFYDSEFGTPQSYFSAFGIPLDRVFHVPVTDIEQLKFDIMQQLDGLGREDKVMIVIDSIGNLASKKEVDDALAGNNKADMTRAKQLKSLGRMITPHLTLKDIPLFAINHIYMTQEMYAKAIVGGGTGLYYSADNIYIVGRQQEKDGTEVSGYNFVINVEKSRFVKEKSKVLLNVTFDKGINKWSGLLPIALETGHVVKPKVGWYAKVNTETGEIEGKNYREKETHTADFWMPILKDEVFRRKVKEMFKLAEVSMIEDDVARDQDMDDEGDDE